MEQNNLESKIKAESNHQITREISRRIICFSLGLLTADGLYEGITNSEKAYMLPVGIIAGVVGYYIANKYSRNSEM